MADSEDEFGEELGGDPVGETGSSADDDALLSSIDFSNFLSGSSPLDGVDFNAASGINAIRVAEAAIASLAFALLYGVNSLIDAWTTAVARAIDAGRGFIGDLIGATLGVGISAVEGVWSFTVSEYGLLAYPIALIIVLATFYVADQGISTAREVLF